MSNAKSKQAKPKTGLARCMELAADRKGLVFLAAVLSSLAAIASFIPYIAVYFMIRSIIGVFPNLDQLDMGMVMNYGWLALAGIVANILLYFLAIFSSHMAAFGTLYELKVLFADHITKIPLGYHLTIGSGRLRKIMDENIESVEGFIAHQFPDFVASITAPIVMVIILLAVDWRFGLASLVGIILAFVAEFIGFGSGEMKENMGKYQKALEDQNSKAKELADKLADAREEAGRIGDIMGAYERNIVDQERSIRTQDRLNSANIDLFNKRADKKEAQEAKKAQEKLEKERDRELKKLQREQQKDTKEAFKTFVQGLLMKAGESSSPQQSDLANKALDAIRKNIEAAAADGNIDEAEMRELGKLYVAKLQDCLLYTSPSPRDTR